MLPLREISTSTWTGPHLTHNFILSSFRITHFKKEIYGGRKWVLKIVIRTRGRRKKEEKNVLTSLLKIYDIDGNWWQPNRFYVSKLCLLRISTVDGFFCFPFHANHWKCWWTGPDELSHWRREEGINCVLLHSFPTAKEKHCCPPWRIAFQPWGSLPTSLRKPSCMSKWK